MSNTASTNASGTTPLFLLFLLFLGLKLTGFIAWSWWWVTIPLWGGLALVLGFMLIAAIVVGVVHLATRRK